MTRREPHVPGSILRAGILSLGMAAAAGLAGCGGGDPLDNPPAVANAGGAAGSSLSFAYFQRCINPILNTPHSIDLNGTVTTNTCSAAGCHDNVTGRGGALRIVPTATTVDMDDPANTPDVIRATDMYKNFFSAQAETVINDPAQSLLINKPLLRNVLHGGGLIFSSVEDPNIQKMEYWISNPMPAGQDEFSPAAANLFTPADVTTGVCNTN
jgi:hypothetical protein